MLAVYLPSSPPINLVLFQSAVTRIVSVCFSKCVWHGRYQFMDAPGEDPPPIKAGFRTTDNSLSKTVLGLEYTDSE